MASRRSSPLSPSSSRERLLDAAKRLFAAHGYEATATSAIAREAGTSESQLMRYFGGKAGLLEAVFDRAWDQINTRVERIIAQTPDAQGALLDAIQAVSSALTRDRDLAILVLFEGRRLRAGSPRIQVSRGGQAFIQTIRELVRRARQNRLLSTRFDADAVASALLGAAEGMMRDRLLAPSARTRAFADKQIRHTLEGMLNGLAPARR